MTDKTRAAKDREQLTKFREAHPNIDLPEDALLTAGPWPSLQLSDFIVYLERKAEVEDNPEFKVVGKVLRGIQREVAWAYGGWSKALTDGDPNKLLQNVLNDAKAPAEGDQQGHFAFVRRFIKDYALAHGYFVDEPQETSLDMFGELGISFDGMAGGVTPTPVPVPNNDNP